MHLEAGGLKKVTSEPAAIANSGFLSINHRPSRSPLALFILLAAGVLFASCSFSLVGDVTPPPVPPSIPQAIHATSTVGDLFVERAHVFFSLSTTGKLQVEEMLAITNQGSQPVKALPGKPVLEIELPDGAQNLQFLQNDNESRFHPVPTGFIDTQAIPVGGNQPPIIFSYELPYSGDLTLALKFPLPVKAGLLTAPGSGLQVIGRQIEDLGEQTVQGMRLHFFGLGSLSTGESLRIQVSSASNSWLVNNSGAPNLLVGLAAFLLALGVVFWRARK